MKNIVNLEITNKCNAICPQCYRVTDGGRPNPDLVLTELSLKDIQTILNEETVRGLRKLYMSGEYGDPAIARDTLDVYRWLRSVNPDLELGMCTNGSLRNTEWWASLGKILNKENDYCEFGIDGFMDTFHLAKIRTFIQKVFENAKAFIDAGGNASWVYIVFKHNQEEIEAARQHSINMGFKKFILKRSDRFDQKSKTGIYSNVLDKYGNFVYRVEPGNIDNINYQKNLPKNDELNISAQGTIW